MIFLTLVAKSLLMAVAMFWNILWALILGFMLSGITITFVPRKKITAALGKIGAKEISFAMFLGAVSSSCSYGAASMAHSLFKKGAHIIVALAFLLASTNLVLEMSLILWVMMGWQFVVAEFIGGIILVSVMAILMYFFGPLKEFENLGGQENLEPSCHDETMDGGWRGAARAFVMEWQMIWKDIALGMIVSSFLMVFVPDQFWQTLFLQGPGANSTGVLKLIENALIGPLISVISFVCSIGNIPLAGALYRGGISFGGALSFIYADLIIIPLILVYRKYFGNRLAFWITGIFYVSMVLTGLIVEFLFNILGWVPEKIAMPTTSNHGFGLNYTFYLNLIFMVLALIFVWLSKPQPSRRPLNRK